MSDEVVIGLKVAYQEVVDADRALDTFSKKLETTGRVGGTSLKQLSDAFKGLKSPVTSTLRTAYEREFGQIDKLNRELSSKLATLGRSNLSVDKSSEIVKRVMQIREEITRALASVKSTATMVSANIDGQIQANLEDTIAKFERGVRRSSRAAKQSQAGSPSLLVEMADHQAKIDSTNKLTNAHKRLGEESGKAVTHVNGLSKALWDNHSAVRGLASGFGLLYLTWGSTLPLLSGAAISFGVAQTLKDGKELSKVLADIQYVAGVSASDMREFNAVMLDSKNGAAGPLEVANAMKQLSLAGLSATEAMTALPVVLNLAKVSGVEVGKTAESLTAVSTAFGFSAKGYEHVADVIGVTAASTMADIGDMTEAFRASSVVAQQYGVSLEDIATSLGLLSQVGVKGSAAGTAVRQMYTELMGSSVKAQKALKSVFDLKVIDDATGKMKPLDEIIGHIAGKLADMPRSAQLAQLDKIGNERGLKALSANLSEIINKAGDSSEALKNLKDAVDSAAGFTALAAIGKSTSFGAQWESAGADLKRTMAGAFTEVESYATRFMLAVRDMFSTPEMKSALTDLLTIVLRFGTALLENIGVIVTVGKMLATAAITWVGFNLTLSASAAVAGLADTAYRKMTMGLAAVGPVSATATVSIRALNLAMGSVGIALTVAASAWLFFADKAESATDRAAKEASDYFKMTKEGLDQNVTRLEKEIAGFEQVADAAQRGAWVQAELLKDSLAQKHKSYEATLQMAVAEAELTEVIAERGQMFAGGGEAALLAAAQTGAASTLAAARRDKLQAARVAHAAEMQQMDSQIDKVMALTRRRAELAKIESDKKSRPFGKITPPEEDTSKVKDHTAEVAARGKAELDQLRTDMKSKLELLKDYHDAGTLSQGKYEADSLAVLISGENAQLAKLKTNRQEELDAVEKHRQEANAKLKDKPNDRAAAIESINNKIATINAQFEADRLKLVADVQNRERDLWVKHEKALLDIRTKGEEKLAGVRDRIDSMREDADVARLTAGMQGPQLAATEARLKVELSAKKELRLMDKKVAEENLASVELIASAESESNFSIATAQLEAAARHNATVLHLMQLRKTLEIAYGEEAAVSSALAYDKAFKAEADSIAKALSSGITDALFEGGKSGWKKLRDVLRQELLQKPFRMIIEAVIQPVSQALAGGVQGFTNGMFNPGGGASGLGSMAGSAFSSWLGSTSIGSAFAGSGTAMLAGMQGTLGFGGATATAAQAATAANMGAASSVAGAQSSILAGAQAIGQAIPYVAAALVALNALGVFRKTKQVGAGVSGTIGAESGINSYAEMRKSGTLFRGPSYWKEYTDMAEASSAISTAAKGMIGTVTNMAKSLGMNADKVAGHTMAIDEAAMKFDQRGMTEAQIQAKYTELLTAQMQKYNEELYAQVGGLSAVSKYGETAAQTLARLYSDYSNEQTAKAAILKAQGKDAEALAVQRALETNLMDETTKAAKLRIYALEDEVAAAEKAATSVKSLTDAISETFKTTSHTSISARVAEYDKNYVLAQSTTGAERSKYADLLASTLPSLAQDLAAVSATRQEWVLATTAMAAKAANIAKLLDPTAQIPAFASGGYHTGGLRLVGENGPELEFTGPSHILNNQMTSAILGGSGQADTAALEALVARLIEQIELMRYETKATATHTAKMAKLQTDNYERGQLIRTDADQPIATTAV